VAGAGAPPPPGESPTELVGLWRRRSLVGVGAVRPCVVLAARLDADTVDAFLPFLDGFLTGLVKTPAEAGDAIWCRLAENGRRALVDRTEVAHLLERAAARSLDDGGDAAVRDARPSDLPELVEAARASLRDEGRPDPSEGDPEGFRRWVRGRLDRACVVEEAGRVAFVGYADVRRPEGWLVQGVFTRPDARRRGLGRRGVAALCRRAFEAGADHVQLSVVEGNTPATALYASLGFRPFARLRTILFGG
jgi:ribosomal protein S18 acetylase RimI-like enzyme